MLKLKDKEGILSPSESVALRKRLGDQTGSDEPVTLEDMAEATGLSEAEVLEQIRQLRAESAFSEPKPTPASSPLPWIAVGALVVAAGVTGWRISLGDGMPSFKPIPTSSLPSASPPPPIATRPQVTRSLSIVSDGNLDHLTPPGLEVHAMGPSVDFYCGSFEPGMTAWPYEAVVSGLVASASEAVEHMIAQEQLSARVPGRTSAPPGTEFRDMKGNVFSSRPGQARILMSGWAGTQVAWVSLPLDAAGKKVLEKQARDLLEDVRKEQAEALSTVSDPSAGIIAPPPGFSIRFAGRRLDVQQGPRISFAGIPRVQVVDRLKAALLNAINRDHRAPLGRWTGDPAKDAKIPVPSFSHVEVLGPETMATAEIPTKPGEEAATHKAVEQFANQLADQIDVLNHKAEQPSHRIPQF